MLTAKCRGAVAPALRAAPSLLASVDSQIVRRQRVAPATMAWDILSPDFAAIDIGEVDDRRTISTNQMCTRLQRPATYTPVVANRPVAVIIAPTPAKEWT